MAIIDYVLPTRINSRWQGARTKLSTLDTAQPPLPLKVLISGQKEPIAPTGTINNPFRTAKLLTNGNHRRNHKQSVTEASHQDKPWKVRCALYTCNLLIPQNTPTTAPMNNTNNTQTAKAQHQNAAHHPPHTQKELTPGQEEPIAPTGTINNPIRTSSPNPGHSPQAPLPRLSPGGAKATSTIKVGVTCIPPLHYALPSKARKSL